MSNNNAVRGYLELRQVKLWQLADMIGIAPTTLSRYMRFEWSKDLQRAVCELIDGEQVNTNRIITMLRNEYRVTNTHNKWKVGNEEWVKRQLEKIEYMEITAEQKEAEREKWLNDLWRGEST